MLINIWATIIHLSDASFSGADNPSKPGLDLLICERLNQITDHKQTWMINPLWFKPGISSVLLRESYSGIKNTSESYLILVTLGFADIVYNVPVELAGRNITQICRRARMFNKRVIIPVLGTPDNMPDAAKKRLER